MKVELLFAELSNESLLDLYEGVRRALAEDDRQDDPTKRRFLVRETKDWREWAEGIERTLDARGVAYLKIVW